MRRQRSALMMRSRLLLVLMTTTRRRSDGLFSLHWPTGCSVLGCRTIRVKKHLDTNDSGSKGRETGMLLWISLEYSPM